VDRAWPLTCLPFPEWCLQMLQNWNWIGVRIAAGFHSFEWQETKTLVYGFFDSRLWNQIVFLWRLHLCGKQQCNQYYEGWMSNLFPNETPLQLQSWLRNLNPTYVIDFFKVVNRKHFFQNKHWEDSEGIKSSWTTTTTTKPMCLHHLEFLKDCIDAK
jgi:hypothetical protein